MLALFVATTALGLFLARAGRPVAARRPHVVSPPARGVYVGGGVPARDAAMHELLAGDFTEFVLAVARRDSLPASRAAEWRHGSIVSQHCTVGPRRSRPPNLHRAP